MQASHLNRTALSFASLVVFVFLAVGSVDTKVTVDAIDAAKDALRASLASVNTKAGETTAEVDSAYAQLRSFLDERNLTNGNLEVLEARLDKIKLNQNALNLAFLSSKRDGEKLFGMLKRRAEENGTQSLREKMIRDIDSKQQAFQTKVAAAKQLLSKIDESVQKYDDIVGYCQVNKGLEGVDSIIADVESTMKVGAQLNEEIRGYVNEGAKIIESL